MSLTERMRCLTSQPASIFGMTDLGMVKEGMAADLLLFGPATVGRGQGGGYLYCPVALHVWRAVGVHTVWVNGQLVADRNEWLNQPPLAGKLLTEFAS